MRKPVPQQSLPFALVERGAKGLRLAAVNAAAQNFGLMRGQRLADARAAVPDLLTEEHDAEQDQASLLGLCRWMERYSPWVSPDARDGILLDATGIPHLFGGEQAMQRDIIRRLAEHGFTVKSSCAATIGAAWALARYARDGETETTSLPVEALRIAPEAARTLRRLGLKTIGSLIDIPRAALARRFRGERIDDNVLIRLDELLGLRAEPLNPLNPPSSFMAHRALIEPVISHEGLEQMLRLLIQSLCRDLEEKGEGARRLILKLFRSDGGRAQIPVGLSLPSHDPRHMLRLLQPKLQELDAGFGIDAMTLEARDTARLEAQQQGFMAEAPAEALAPLSDRVMNRHQASLVALQAVASHIPERAERHVPVARYGEKTSEGRPESFRPLLIFTHPEPVSIIAAVPDGAPLRMTWRRVSRKIVKAEGPERIAPEWWRLDQTAQQRDYFRIEDEQGRRYWVFRDGLYGEGCTSPKWFVHGLSA